MKRRAFIKSTGLATIGTTGVFAKSTNWLSKEFSNLPLNSPAFKERQIVIVQLHGGNDGLNAVIPLNEYTNYANLRPSIKIPESSLITLDNTLADDHKIGLHPALSKFKDLYDNGKLNVLQGVGYPSPNYSHFRSTDILFRGLDGTSGSLNTSGGTDSSGWMAKYLSAIHPNYAGLPTPNLEHPLGIHIGTSSTNIGFEHQTNFNMGINIYAKAREQFYGDLSLRTTPQATNSEYKDLLNYINNVEKGAQKYKDAIENAFYAGTNSYNSYPNTDLSKQLKVILRLIKGGLNSKIFTCYRGGFDTHVNQVDNTNSAIGKHTNLLNDFSESIYAFQKDLEMSGLADKVILLTKSEFGRKLRENGNKGTDHGNLAPWFVVGNNVKAGVTGRNIKLSPSFVSNSGRSLDARQNDYRQVLSTLCQDWFGGNDTVLDKMSLQDFKGDIGTTNGKLDIIESSAKVPENNLLEVLTDPYIEVNELVELKQENGWTYYGKLAEPTEFLFALEKKPTLGNTVDFSPLITIKNLFEDGEGKNYFEKFKNDTKHLTLGHFWTIKNAPNLNGFINLRFFIHSDRLNSLQTLGDSFQSNTSSSHNSGIMWLKSKIEIDNLNNQQKINGFNTGVTPLKNQSFGIYEGLSFIQFNEVTSINNTSGLATQIIFEKARPSIKNRKKGELYFDKISKKFRGWNGQKWVDIGGF